MSVPWFVTAIKMPLFELTGSITLSQPLGGVVAETSKNFGNDCNNTCLGGPRAGGVKTMLGTFRPEAPCFSSD